MLTLPLGPKTHTHQFPWVTLAILVVTVLSSALSFRDLDRLEDLFLENESGRTLLRAQLAVVAAGCEPWGFSSAACLELKQVPADQPDLLRVRLSKAISGLKRREIRRLTPLLTRPESLRRQIRDHGGVPPETVLEFETADAKATDFRGSALRERGFLSRDSVSLGSLARAQATHGGWMHLIGNMAFLLFFAIALEQRLGRIAVLGLYILTGTFGLAVSAWGIPPGVPIVGASANVFGVAGAFAWLFRRESIRVWVSLFFVHNRTVELPSWMFFAAFVLTSEFAGLLSAGTNVAHDAHLAAFALGFGAAWIAGRLERLPEGFLYPSHAREFAAARIERDPRRRYKALYRLVQQGALGKAVRDRLFETVLEQQEPATLGHYLREVLPVDFKLRLAEGDLGWFRALRPDWDLRPVIRGADPQALTRTADALVHQREYAAGLRLYGLYLHLFPRSSRAAGIRETIRNLEDLMKGGRVA